MLSRLCLGRAVVLGYIVLVLPFSLAGAQAADALAREVEKLVTPYVASNDFSGAILLARGDTVLFEDAYGMADYAHRIPNTTATKFRVGSVTKQFTAAAILIAEQQGLLHTTDTLARFFPDFPSGDQITIHHLLTHTGGLARDVFEDERYYRVYRALPEVMDIIQRKPLLAEPGTQMQYSNCGYVVLAALLEQVSGHSYAAFLDEHIFTPLGMNHSGIEAEAVIYPDLAMGYDPGWGPFGRMPTPQAYQANILGASGLYTTVGDLHRWSQALTADVLLTDASRRRMLTNHADGRGYGVGVFSRSGRRVIGHDGVTYGFTASLNHYIEDEVTVIFATNMRTGIVSTLERGLAAAVFGEPFTPEASPLAGPTLPAEETYAFVGRYELFPGFYLDISQQADHVLLAGTAGYSTLLTPLTDDTFFYRALYARIRFERDETGEVYRLVWIDRSGSTYPAVQIRR